MYSISLMQKDALFMPYLLVFFKYIAIILGKKIGELLYSPMNIYFERHQSSSPK